MDRVLVVGTKDVMEPAINALYELNLLHIEDYTGDEEYFHIGKPLKNATSLSEKLLKLRSLKSYLGTKEVADPSQEPRAKILKELDSSLPTLEQDVTRRTSEKSGLESTIKDIDHRLELLKPYEALGLPLDLLTGYENVEVFTGVVPGDVEPVVKSITGDYELFSAPYDNHKIIALFVPKAVAGKVSEALNKSDFVEIEPLREKGEPSALHKSLDEAKAKAADRLKQVNTELAELNKKYARFILSSDELLTMDMQKAEAPLRFVTSDNTFVAEGWVPTTDFDRFKATIEKVTGDSAYVTKIEPETKPYKNELDAAMDKHIEHHEVDAPVKYNNPKVMGPIESIIDAYGRPRYDEIDPTMIFSIVFPIFYGFILGDIAYGFLILLLVLFLRSKLKTPGFQVLTYVMIACAVSSIIFGFLFGEFLGYSIAEPIVNGKGGIMGLVSFEQFYPHNLQIGSLGPISLPLERMKAGGFNDVGSYVFGIKDLLVFTCLVGVFQILLGYAIGFWNELKQHGLKTAILHKVSWASILIGGVLVVWYVFPLAMTQSLGTFSATDPTFLVGIVLAVVGLVLLMLGEGPMGLIEVISLGSNVLSYTRLLAVGLSSVGIAFAINTICAMIAGAGIIGLIGAIIVFLLGHTVNLVLGLYAPFIQSLRLHYVEFFQKFYKSGGRIYNPFGYIKKYTED